MTPGADGLCAFAVKRGDIDGRIDAHFYNPKFTTLLDKIKSTEYTSLGKIVTFANETINFANYAYSEFPYIEISAVKLGINEYSISTVNVEDAPSRAKMIVRKDDIIISSTRPHRGAIARIKPEDDGSIASTGFCIIRDVEGNFERDFLLNTLLTEFCLAQFMQRSSGGNYPAITEDEINNIILPIISKERQRKLTFSLGDQKEKYKAKLAQADELLSGMDEYVLSLLEILPEAKQNQYNYAVNFKDIDKRLDVDYYSNAFKDLRDKIDKSQHKVVLINDICKSIKSGFAAGKQDQAEETIERVPHLRPFNITPFGELSFETQKYVPIEGLREESFCEKGEIIFNNTNSAEWVGKSTVFDSELLCAASNHITRIQLIEGINEYYISALFNAFRKIGYWKLLSTYFNNQAGINMDTLCSVKIILPTKDIQSQIADEAVRRRSLARQLKEEANKEWQSAKAQFEKELLGE